MQYSFRIGENSYTVEIEDLSARPVIVTVQGEQFKIWPEEHLPETGNIPPLKTAQKQPITASDPCPPTALPPVAVTTRCVTAPIPGVIVAINVKPGQVVTRGEELCVLEAMKMKNSIRSARDGVIATISTSVGEQVSHGQPLLEFTN